MKILLIYPDTDPLSIIPSGLINIEPLGLEYLAGELAEHNVKILDLKIVKEWSSAVEQFQPDIVGITGTVVHTTRMLEILNNIKNMFPAATTVVGGPHATLVPDDFLSPAVDALVPYHQPAAFRSLVEAVERGRDLRGVDGILLRSNFGWEITYPLPAPNSLNHLPLPRRDLTSGYRHKYCHLVWKPVALMITSVGCPHGCSFCPCPVLTDRRVLRRQPEIFLQELEQIAEPYIYIGDDNLFFDYQNASRIAELIRRAGIKKEYYALSRADSIVKHPDLVELWAGIGLKKVFIGLESPNDDEIKALNKKGTVSENNRALEILHANNVDPLGAFIINPDYVRADFDRILEYMDRMEIYYFEFTVLTPFPGTQFYDEVKSDIISYDTRLFDLAHSLFPTRLPQNHFYRELSRLHRKAASPIRAMRINPVVSPFKRMAYFRQAPQLVRLFLSARKSYRMISCMPERNSEQTQYAKR